MEGIRSGIPAGLQHKNSPGGIRSYRYFSSPAGFPVVAGSPAEAGLFLPEFLGYRQFMASFLPAACQYFTAVGGLHPLAESVNGFTAAGMRLECTFHVFLLFHCLKIRLGEQPGFRPVHRSPHPWICERTAKVGNFSQSTTCSERSSWPRKMAACRSNSSVESVVKKRREPGFPGG